MDTKLHYLTATGDVATHELNLRSIHLTAGDAAAATLTLKAGGSGGSVVAVLKAPQGTTTVGSWAGAYIVAPHVTLAGADAVCTVEG